MLRRVSNPVNPYASAHVEWLGPPPPATLEVFEEDARSIVAENDSPDVPFRFSVNPYRGCQHACAYCYARPTHEHLGFGAGTDFDLKIVVKRNAPQLLERELRRPRLGDEWIAFSGVTDCYQPLEASWGLTRACLEVCLHARRAVGIVTKGALVRRDADLLARLAQVAGARVFVSIPTLDEDVARALEPWAPAPRVRLETLRALGRAGVPTGVAIAPLIPGLGESGIPAILSAAHEAGARHAFTILLRLVGPVRPVFVERLRAALPLRAAKVLAALEDMRSAQAAPGDFGQRFRGAGPRWDIAHALFETTCRRLGLSTSERAAHERAGPDALSDFRPEVRPEVRPAPGPAGGVQLSLFDGGD